MPLPTSTDAVCACCINEEATHDYNNTVLANDGNLDPCRVPLLTFLDPSEIVPTLYRFRADCQPVPTLCPSTIFPAIGKSVSWGPSCRKVCRFASAVRIRKIVVKASSTLPSAAMFCGHYGAALLVKALTDTPMSLLLLFTLSHVQDILVAIFSFVLHLDTVTNPQVPPDPHFSHIALVGVPYSHSLFTTAAICALTVVLYESRTLASNGLLLTVASHLLLDFIAHYPPTFHLC